MSEHESKTPSASRPPKKKQSVFALFFLTLGRILTTLLVTVLIVFVFLYAVCAVVTNGPSENAKILFVN